MNGERKQNNEPESSVRMDEEEPTISTAMELSEPGTSRTEFQFTSARSSQLVSYSGSSIKLNIMDPGIWPVGVSDAERCLIVKELLNVGEIKPTLTNSRRDGRHLTKDWFYKNLPNVQKNALFCISCKLFFAKNFETENVDSQMAKEEGFTQWEKLNERIPHHKNS